MKTTWRPFQFNVLDCNSSIGIGYTTSPTSAPSIVCSVDVVLYGSKRFFSFFFLLSNAHFAIEHSITNYPTNNNGEYYIIKYSGAADRWLFYFILFIISIWKLEVSTLKVQKLCCAEQIIFWNATQHVVWGGWGLMKPSQARRGPNASLNYMTKLLLSDWRTENRAAAVKSL